MCSYNVTSTGYENYIYKRKLKESIFIQQLDDGKLFNDFQGFDFPAHVMLS